jgi:hypothetical protein
VTFTPHDTASHVPFGAAAGARQAAQATASHAPFSAAAGARQAARKAREVREGAGAPLRGSNCGQPTGALLHDPRLTLELVTFAYIKQAGG